LNSEDSGLTPLCCNCLQCHKREDHYVLLEEVREHVGKVVSNKKLDFGIICLKQLSHICQLKDATVPITPLSIEKEQLPSSLNEIS